MMYRLPNHAEGCLWTYDTYSCSCGMHQALGNILTERFKLRKGRGLALAAYLLSGQPPVMPPSRPFELNGARYWRTWHAVKHMRRLGQIDSFGRRVKDLRPLFREFVDTWPEPEKIAYQPLRYDEL